ncbi:MAG: dihydroneopterin aldolase family protein [Halapricum sp.]
MPTDAQQACFEAGIKFGSLYHQFAGTPVSAESADSLAGAMEEAIENQPYCASVTVEIRTDVLAEEIEAGSAEYTELTGRFLDVEIEIAYEDRTVLASMEMEDGYPLMRLDRVE